MKNQIIKLYKNPLIASSLIMIIGSNFANFLNYIYHLSVGRLLGPVGYGELAGILSLSGLITILPGSLNLVVTKFISSAKNEAELHSLIHWITSFSFVLGGGLAIFVIIASPFLSSFFKFNSSWLLIILAVSFFFSIPASYNRSILQGRLLFKGFVVTVVLENFLRLALGVALIYLGWSTYGAMAGIALASFFGWFSTHYFLKIFSQKKSEKSQIDKKEIFFYTVPILIQSLATTSLYSSDVLVVKHFFDGHTAGIYASLSTLAKIIFFATGPISAVMFPMVAKRKTDQKNFFSIFWWSLLLTTGVSLGVLFIYWIIPGIIVNILYGSLYQEAKQFLFPISLSMGLFAISSLCISFALSINKVKIVILPVLSAIIQITGMIFFHQNLLTIIYVSLLTNVLLCLLTIGFILKLNYEKA